MKLLEVIFGAVMLLFGVGLLCHSVTQAGPGVRSVWMVGAFLGGGVAGLVVRQWARRRLNITSCA